MDELTITPDVLWRLPIRRPEGGDKRERGVVLIIGGCVEQPGGAMLAAMAALRAGAGKARIATCVSMAPYIATAVPESRVYGLPETAGGAIDPAGIDRLEQPIAEADAVVIGPGMFDPGSAAELADGIVRRIDDRPVLLDAAALSLLAHDRTALRHLRGRCVITPHRGEMAALTEGFDHLVDHNEDGEVALACAEETGVVTVLKGPQTYIAAPSSCGEVGDVFPPLADESAGDGVPRLFRNVAGNAGLATSGSGDVLAGMLAAFLARGVDPLNAAVWAVYAHAVAGDRLARSTGIGFLARELADELPRVLMLLLDGLPPI